jgi:hypothetical protein
VHATSGRPIRRIDCSVDVDEPADLDIEMFLSPSVAFKVEERGVDANPSTVSPSPTARRPTASGRSP